MGFDEAAREVLLDLQFRAQRQAWEAKFLGAEHELILVEGRPVGRIWLAWSPEDCRVVDVALLPEYRRRGVGTQVYSEILAEADRRGIPVRTTVDPANGPSMAFHLRCGFEVVAEDDAWLAIERPVSAARPPRASS